MFITWWVKLQNVSVINWKEKKVYRCMHIACTSLYNIRQYSVLTSVKRVIIYWIQSCVQDRDMVKCTPSEIIWDTGYMTGMAYRLNFTDNGLPIFDQSRLPITDILSVLSFTDTDILEIADISVFYRYTCIGGKSPKYSRYLEPIFGQSWQPIANILLVLTFTDTDNRYLKMQLDVGNEPYLSQQ